MIEVPCNDGQAGDRQLGKTCQGCGQWVREGRTSAATAPRSCAGVPWRSPRHSRRWRRRLRETMCCSSMLLFWSGSVTCKRTRCCSLPVRKNLEKDNPLIEVPCHDGQAGDRQLGKTCQGCGQWVREGRTHCHGLPKSSKNARLGDEEVADVFVNSARVGIYIFAAVFHCRSKIIWSTHACRTS